MKPGEITTYVSWCQKSFAEARLGDCLWFGSSDSLMNWLWGWCSGCAHLLLGFFCILTPMTPEMQEFKRMLQNPRNAEGCLMLLMLMMMMMMMIHDSWFMIHYSLFIIHSKKHDNDTFLIVLWQTNKVFTNSPCLTGRIIYLPSYEWTNEQMNRGKEGRKEGREWLIK